jgi:phenylacetic acid degradation protein PaaN
MKQVRSYLAGAWHEGQAEPIALVDPATEEVLAGVRPVEGLAEAMAYARRTGGKNLRTMSLQARREMLAALSKVLHAHREELLDLSMTSGGNTRGDAKFDVDGATAVLAAYAHLGKSLGDGPWIVDGEAVEIMRGSKIRAQHVLLPRHGVAVHINAFNFPAWGMVGKLAVSLLAGMPVLTKPATSTCLLAARMAEIIVESGLVPEGAFQILLGPAGDLLDHVEAQDVIAFTGSAATGAKIRGHQRVLSRNVRVNVEADSLNAVIIGPDVEPGTELFDLAVRDAVVELTQKAGQKCTATRRILVPHGLLDAFREALTERLSEISTKTGAVSDPGVRMGPLSTAQQLTDARAGVEALQRNAELILGDPMRRSFVGVPDGKGWFIEPILLQATLDAARNPEASYHHTEVFGPVATLLPYDGSVAVAAEIVALGQGSLVSTAYSDDRAWTAEAVAEFAPYLGRLVLASEKVAAASITPGCVFAVANHGGPGRAGAGAELGGRVGLELYMQRTTLQGGGAQLARLLGTK